MRHRRDARELAYRLTEHLGLEAESGVRQGLDLLLSIERDDACSR